MAKQLKVNFKTIRTGCQKAPYSTRGHFNEEMALVTNVPQEILDEVRGAYDVIVDKARKTITLLRNAQFIVHLRDKQYAYDVLITFCGGKLVVTSVCTL